MRKNTPHSLQAPHRPGTLLIANRGEIACRIAHTARQMGWHTVAVFSEADAGAAHVQACDQAVCIGPAPALHSYLNVPRLLQAARDTGADAVHPGYGFLSENADFAQACLDAGLLFVGPPPSAIRTMGDKAAAKRCMADAGVPLVPGYHGEAQDLPTLQAEAERMGYPVMVKAVAGGGGKGMRLVHESAQLAAALAACQREAAASFGDARVLIEHGLIAPRHIEVQVFCDRHGQGVHLFERDCSVQRRHQKVLEEAPAPGLSPLLRERMGQAAVLAAQSVGYVGAGTVEFICAQDVARTGRFYFMEMNTRLQVEHPVTEALTGIDLVAWQLRVARGEPLPLAQEQIHLQGHAIEARLCAEQPRLGLLPATGTVHHLRWPAHRAWAPAPMRVDTGLREGDAVTPHYDAMVAKLIAHGPDRATAIARLQAGLAHLQLAGVAHNGELLQRVLGLQAFQQGQVHTHLIDDHADALLALPDDTAVQQALAALAQHLRQAPVTHAADPWARGDGWRLHGRPTLQGHVWWLDATPPRRLPLPASWPEPSLADTTAIDTVNIATCTVVPRPAAPGTPGTAQAFDVFTPAGLFGFVRGDPLQEALQAAHAGSASGAGTGSLNAPMPGRVVAIDVQAGQHVQAGQRLALTEAMKMEHAVCAPHDGVVSDVLCVVGEAVAQGQPLLRLSRDDAPTPPTASPAP